MFRAGTPSRGVRGQRRFVRDEDGGATVEWLVAAAVLVFVALPVLALVNDSSQMQGRAIAVQVAEADDTAVSADIAGSAAMPGGEAPDDPAVVPGADLGIGYAASEAARLHTRRISDLAHPADPGASRAVSQAGASRFYTGTGDEPAHDPVTRVADARSHADRPAADIATATAGQTPIPGCFTLAATPTSAKFVPAPVEDVATPVAGPGR